MEVTLKPSKKCSVLEELADIVPDSSHKSVAKDVKIMLAKLPSGRGFDLENNFDAQFQRLDPANLMMRAYFTSIFEDLAEVRNSVKDLAPILRNSQKRVQTRVIAYARNYTFLTKQLQSMQKEDGEDPKNKPLWKRMLHSMLCIVAPFYSSERWPSRKKLEKRVRDELEAFYIVNGVDCRVYINRAMRRCDKMERILIRMKDEVKYPGRHLDGTVAGLARQLRLPSSEMNRWSRDIQLAWLEVRAVKRVCGMLPSHTCWRAIFNIMARQTHYNRYI